MEVRQAANADWECVAVFELDAHAPIADSLRGNASDSCHLVLPARESPPGRRRFEVYVDFAIGTKQAVLLAQEQVEAVEQWAAAGMMPGYRLLSGREWLRNAAEPQPLVRRHLASVSSARDLN